MDRRITLREFSLHAANKKGIKFHIQYGYDLSKGTPAYYVKASIDGKAPSSTKAVLKRVSKLGIEPINHLISLIGCDETGAVDNLDNVVFDAFVKHMGEFSTDPLLDEMTSLLRLTDDKDVAKLEKIIVKVSHMQQQGKSEKALRGVITRYLKSQRLRLLLDVRSTVQSLRKLFYKGVELHGTHYTVKKEGYLNEVHYPTYYKRDMDLIRASRIRIYKEVLKKEYIPVKD